MRLHHIAGAAGISVPTLTALRKGTNVPTEDTKRGVENALRWEPGSIDDILAGGEPTVAKRSTVAREKDAEEEDQFAKMDRLYEEWKRDPARRQALWTILRTGEEKDAG